MIGISIPGPGPDPIFFALLSPLSLEDTDGVEEVLPPVQEDGGVVPGHPGHADDLLRGKGRVRKTGLSVFRSPAKWKTPLNTKP